MRTIFKALNAVQSELAQLGIGKNQRNDFDKYQYRGIDDVLNALAPILARNGVLIVPSVVEKELRQVATQKGGMMNFATLRVDYTMYDSEGDSITHTAYGEAMDRGDKSINKAMTAAYKYFVFQAFCVPLVGHDADSESHEIIEKTVTKDQAEKLKDLAEKTGNPEGFLSWLGVESFEDIPAQKMQVATRQLNKKMESMNERAA
jgi:hypothetical protein